MERSHRRNKKAGRADNPSNDTDATKNPLVCLQLLSQSLYELGFDQAGGDYNQNTTMETSNPYPNRTHGSTSTPKRRRKENGRGSRVRFSPEKKHHLRSQSGSLLDHQQFIGSARSKEEDEQSQLIGARFALPQQLDELSYSDSEGSPPVARNLTHELGWENLEESDFEKESPRRKTRKPQSSSLVGGVVTVCPKDLRAAGRQVSECSSDSTMEELVSEVSPTSSVRPSDGESHSSEWSSYSRDSLDSGIASTGDESSFGGGDHNHNHQVVETAQDSLHWMWSTQQMRSSAIDQRQYRQGRPQASSKKRSNPHRTVRRYDSLAKQQRQRSPVANRNDMEEEEHGDTSILVDLTEEIKEIAMLAGKSSEKMVSSIFHQLCEET